MNCFRLCCYLLFGMLSVASVIWPVDARAHASADSMPDSVAEVEYNIYLEFKPDDIVVLNKLGMVYYRLRKYSEAVRQFSKVLKADPDNYDALDGMGLVKGMQDELDEAIRYHRRAVAVNGADMMGHYHLGQVLEKKGLLKEAADSYHSALARCKVQYPPGKGNKTAVELEAEIQEAIRNIETRL